MSLLLTCFINGQVINCVIQFPESPSISNCNTKIVDIIGNCNCNITGGYEYFEQTALCTVNTFTKAVSGGSRGLAIVLKTLKSPPF